MRNRRRSVPQASGLMDEILDLHNLWEAQRTVSSSPLKEVPLDERPAVRPRIRGFDLTRLKAAVQKGYQWSPLTSREVLKKHGGGNRCVFRASPRDGIVARAIHQVLSRKLEGVLPTGIYGVTTGRGLHQTVADLHGLLAGKEYRYALTLDVADHFPSVCHSDVMDGLNHYFHQATGGTFPAEVRYLIEGAMQLYPSNSPAVGLSQGISPVPLLVSLVMAGLAEHLSAANVKLFFYLDDLLILGRTEEEILQVQGLVCAWLHRHGFKVSEKEGHEMGIWDLRKEPIDYLGLRWEGSLCNMSPMRSYDHYEQLQAEIEAGATVSKVLHTLRCKSNHYLNLRRPPLHLRKFLRSIIEIDQQLFENKLCARPSLSKALHSTIDPAGKVNQPDFDRVTRLIGLGRDSIGPVGQHPWTLATLLRHGKCLAV